MLRKQNQLRSILEQIYNRTNQSLMSHSICSRNPFFSFSNGLYSHQLPQSSSTKFFSFQCNATWVKGKMNGLVLLGCFDANYRPKAADHKAGAFAFQRVRHLEIEDGCADVKVINGRGSSERGNPLRFFDNPLHEKFIVTVMLMRIWKCSRDEADIRDHEFFKTPYFKNGIHPLPGSQKALHKLSKFCNLSVVTSRQNVIKDHTIEWIHKHYPGLFQEIHFGNHFSLDGEFRPKSEICRSLGAKVQIDDNPRYAIECAGVGIKVLLFDYENSYPWCKTDSVDQHPLVTKVHNWDEVEQQLSSLVVT